MLIMVGIASFSISFSTGAVVIRRNLDSGDCLEKAFCFNSCAASLYYTQNSRLNRDRVPGNGCSAGFGYSLMSLMTILARLTNRCKKQNTGLSGIRKECGHFIHVETGLTEEGSERLLHENRFNKT